jgi:hypothetical protein
MILSFYKNRTEIIRPKAARTPLTEFDRLAAALWVEVGLEEELDVLVGAPPVGEAPVVEPPETAPALVHAMLEGIV